jgi:hypothetical protein
MKGPELNFFFKNAKKLNPHDIKSLEFLLKETEKLKPKYILESDSHNQLLGSEGILLNDSLDETIESTTNQYPDLQKQFNSALIEAMQMVNKNSRNGTGVWYFHDYAKYCSQNNKILNQGLKNGFADNEFWEITGRYKFKIKPNKKPSEAINAFFNGLTIADCGNMIVACQLAALLKVFGADRFDAIFNNSIKPLTISQIICDKDNISSFFFDYADKKDIPTKGLLGNRPIAEGEMCHIGSLPFYPVKHPAGFSGGFNVICLGKNKNGEDLLLGFGPTTFGDKPLTERELLTRFIDLYNLERSTFDAELISSSNNPSIYDMEKNRVKDTITIDEGLKNIKGYLPGSVIKPLYTQISKYQNMDVSEISKHFALDYANSLFRSAMDLEEKSFMIPSSKPMRYFPRFDTLFKRYPIIYKECEDIEKLSTNRFGWTRNGKRYIFEDGKMYKYVPDEICEVKQENMSQDEVNEFKRALDEQSSRLAVAKII